MRVSLKAKAAIAIGALFFVGAWTYAMYSQEYKAASSLLRSSPVRELVGEVQWKLLTSFRLSSVPGRQSTIGVFAFGTKNNGLLSVQFVVGDSAPTIESATFQGQTVQVPAGLSLE